MMPDRPEPHPAMAAPAASKKRSRQTYESLMAIIVKHVDNKPHPLPKRQLNEQHLIAQYAAERGESQQPPMRAPHNFQYTPRKAPVSQPSLFSPATSKLYSSPIEQSGIERLAPARQSTPAFGQQPAKVLRSPMRSPAATPVHNRLSQLPSRLGPSRMQAQATSTPLRIQYLDSAPPLSPAQPAASTSHANGHIHQQLPFNDFLPSGYHATSPASNGTPYGAQNQEDAPDPSGLQDSDAADPQQDAMLASPAQECLFGEHRPDSVHANGVSVSATQEDGGLEGSLHLSDRVAKQRSDIDMSRQSVIKRLAAKRQALSGSASPAYPFQSPSNAASAPRSVSTYSRLKRKATEAADEELSGPRASIRRMETALKGVSQAEKAAEEEAAAARAAASGPARPPTALLGFAPAPQASGRAQSATGKYSWPANFFDDSKKKRSSEAAALDASEQGSETSGAFGRGSRGSGAVSSEVVNGGEAGGDSGQDYGAVWRDAAQSSPVSPSPSPSNTGTAPQVTSPPFGTTIHRTASGNHPDPKFPSPTPPPSTSPTPLQQTPTWPTQPSLFASAASPATVPAKSFDFGGKADLNLPTMFLSGTGKVTSTPSTQEAADKTPAQQGTQGSSGRDPGLDGDKQAAESAAAAPAVLGWGAAFLEGNQSDAAKASKAAAKEAADAAATTSGISQLQSGFGFGVPPSNGNAQDATAGPSDKSSTPASNWGTSFFQSNKRAASQATEAAAKEIAEKDKPGKPEAAAQPKFSFGLVPDASAPQTSTSAAQPATIAPLPSWTSASPPTISLGVPTASTAADPSIKPTQDSIPSTSQPAVSASGWDAVFKPTNQAAASQTSEAAASEAGKQGNTVSQAEAPSLPGVASSPAASGWGSASLESNQSAAAQAADAAAAEAAKEGKPANMAGASAASGLGASLQQANKAAAAQAAQAAAEAAKEGKPNDTPSTAATPAASGWDSPFLASNQASAAQATEAAVQAAKEGSKSGQPASSSVPAASGWGSALMQANQAAVAQAAEAAVEAAKESSSGSQPAGLSTPVASGWGAALLHTNQAAATQATEAAAKEASQKQGDGAQAAAPMTFNFGVPPMAAPSQAASPPWAIPAATGATGSQDGNGSLARDGSWMSISPKSFEARQQDSNSQVPASQPLAAFGQPLTSGGFGHTPAPISFGAPAGIGTLGAPGQQASSDSMFQPANTPSLGTSMAGFGSTGPFGQPLPPANFGTLAGFGQHPQTTSAGFGQQVQANSAGFGQQPQASSAGFSQQPEANQQANQQAGSSNSFSFGVAAAGDASQSPGVAMFPAPQGDMSGAQRPAAGFPQQNPPFSFGALPAAAGQSSFGLSQPAGPAGGVPAFTLGAGSSDARPASASGRRKVHLKRKPR